MAATSQVKNFDHEGANFDTLYSRLLKADDQLKFRHARRRKMEIPADNRVVGATKIVALPPVAYSVGNGRIAQRVTKGNSV